MKLVGDMRFMRWRPRQRLRPGPTGRKMQIRYRSAQRSRWTHRNPFNAAGCENDWLR